MTPTGPGKSSKQPHKAQVRLDRLRGMCTRIDAFTCFNLLETTGGTFRCKLRGKIIIKPYTEEYHERKS